MSFFSCYCLLHENFTEWVERQLPQDIRHASSFSPNSSKRHLKSLFIPCSSAHIYMKTLEIIKSHCKVLLPFRTKDLLALLVLDPYDHHPSIEFQHVLSFSLDKPLTKNKLLNIKCQPKLLLSFHFILKRQSSLFLFSKQKLQLTFGVQ